jgi:cysteinyl-tRNA synthetase
MSEIKLYSTLTKSIQSFNPIKTGEVGIYSCGPTVYNYAHIGNLRAYIFADTLRRMFEYNNYKVKQVINITDVGHLSSDADEGEDKLEKGAKREHKTVWKIAEFYTKAFKADLLALNIEIPEKMPKATDNIDEMIEIVKVLESKGFTYSAGGNIYFNTAQFPNYYNLQGTKPKDQDLNARVETDENKKHPTDFVLWFTQHKYGDHAMLWDSPWGKGFPGWHIECSAMATKYLGDHFDIHTGGIDHISVHHTNEIAQSEGAYGHKWVNYWMHNNFVNVKDGEKMAKSSDNFLRLQTLIDAGYNPLDYRYYLLGGHYRSVMNFSYEALDGAKNARSRLKNILSSLSNERTASSEPILRSELRRARQETNVNDKYMQQFEEKINNDLNTSEALAVLWSMLGDKELSPESKIDIAKKFDTVLGLNLFENEADTIPEKVADLAQKRLEARQNKNWAESDKLRDEIHELGYVVLDRADGYELKVKSE